jgi:hypothetical protein
MKVYIIKYKTQDNDSTRVKLVALTDEEFARIHPHLKRNEGSFPKSGDTYEKVRKDIIKALHNEFLGDAIKDVEVDEYAFSSQVEDFAPLIVAKFKRSLWNVPAPTQQMTQVISAWKHLEESLGDDLGGEEFAQVQTEIDSECPLSTLTSTLFFDDNNKCTLPLNNSLLEDTMSSWKSKSSLFVFYNCFTSCVSEIVRREDSSYFEFFQTLFPELRFHEQVYDIDEEDHELLRFLKSRLKGINSTEFTQSDKVEKLISGLLEVVDITSDNTEKEIMSVCAQDDFSEFASAFGTPVVPHGDTNLFAQLPHSFGNPNLKFINIDNNETVEHFRARVIQQFMNDKSEKASGKSIASHVLFTEFSKWCRVQVEPTCHKIFSKNNFSPALRFLGYETKRLPSGIVWLNLQLTTTTDIDTDTQVSGKASTFYNTVLKCPTFTKGLVDDGTPTVN